MPFTKTMTLGDFRKYTNHLSDDIELNFSYASDTYPIKAMDIINENSIVLGGNLYGQNNYEGSIRVAVMCKKKEDDVK